MKPMVKQKNMICPAVTEFKLGEAYQFLQDAFGSSYGLSMNLSNLYFLITISTSMICYSHTSARGGIPKLSLHELAARRVETA